MTGTVAVENAALELLDLPSDEDEQPVDQLLLSHDDSTVASPSREYSCCLNSTGVKSGTSWLIWKEER